LKIDVENDTKRFLEVSVVLKSFCRWKQDALVAVLPQQSVYSPERSRVIIDHKDKISSQTSIHLSDDSFGIGMPHKLQVLLSHRTTDQLEAVDNCLA